MTDRGLLACSVKQGSTDFRGELANQGEGMDSDLKQAWDELERVRDATNKRLEQRAALLAQAEQEFNKRVESAAQVLAKGMIEQARNERNAARQKARRLQKRLADLEQKKACKPPLQD